jgi:L-threonine-O-3-phosphate decarboxylase/5,6-dimethylbenzimidazole synthase
MTRAEAYHGGLDPQELKRFDRNVAEVVDFSSNILAQGASPGVEQAVRDANLTAYPDRHCTELRQAMSHRWSVDAEHILVGNGASELIHLIASSLIRPQQNVLIVGPTFSEYARAVQLASGNVIECRADESDQFSVPYTAIENELAKNTLHMVWICNPNNPTGQSIPPNRLLSWVRMNPKTVFVVDESYIEFAKQTSSLINASEPNLIVLRSLTKCFGIAGLRLGFAVMATEFMDQLCQRRVPWSVNAPAQVAGVAAIREQTFYDAAVATTLDARDAMMQSLRDSGFDPIPTDANYFLLRLEKAKAVRELLLAEGLVVRDCESFGLDRYVRIAVLDSVNNDRLVDRLNCLVGASDKHTSTKPDSERAKDVCPIEKPSPRTSECHRWDDAFCDSLVELFRLRRDVKRFRPDAIPEGSLRRWIEAACLAPSVGLSEPWKFVTVNDSTRRSRIAIEFETQNDLASEAYTSEAAQHYRSLKLAGLREAPEQLAVFVDPQPTQGRGLGRITMPESVAYSVVTAIQNLWLAARCEGVGIGWVSILRPDSINEILDVPKNWQLIAYLCIGYPESIDVTTPELETCGWEHRRQLDDQWYQR